VTAGDRELHWSRCRHGTRAIARDCADQRPFDAGSDAEDL